MSMYNLLHGMNPNTGILLAILGIDQEGGTYHSGRFRDIFLNGDGSKITLFTRNGGGNRETYQPLIDELAEHPNYIRDFDDDFDCTYASIEFSVPEQYQALCKEMATGTEPKSLKEKLDEQIALMESMSKEEYEKDPRTAHIAKALRPLAEALAKA